MHKYFFIALSLIFSSSCANDTINNISDNDSDTEKHVHNYNGTTNNTNHYNSNSVEISQEIITQTAIELTTIIENTVSNLMQNLSLKIQQIKEQAYDTASRPFRAGKEMCEWALDHKWKLSFFTLVTYYAYINYRLVLLKQELADPQLWSLWNRAMSLEDLFACHQNQLGEMVVREAQRRYTSIENPGDFISPLATLMQAIEKEQKTLNSYISVCSWIKTFRAARIMWHDEKFILQCDERLRRLAYLKSVFVNWVTEYKFIQNIGVPA